MTKVGALQVTDGAEYDRPGEWAVEQLGYYGGEATPSWAVPGWVEDLYGETGFFPTAAQARDFIEFVNA